jgi:hypothetical protein
MYSMVHLGMIFLLLMHLITMAEEITALVLVAEVVVSLVSFLALSLAVVEEVLVVSVDTVLELDWLVLVISEILLTMTTIPI